jgi:hypothetical protein
LIQLSKAPYYPSVLFHFPRKPFIAIPFSERHGGFELRSNCLYNKRIAHPRRRIMNYPLGVEKFIEFFATDNGLTKEEVVEDVVIDWFARIMLKMSLFGLKITQVSPFVWNKETGDRYTGEVLFTILYRRYQDEILAHGANWRRHLEYVERSKATNQKMRDIITELKMSTDAGALASHKPESEQERANKDPESYAIAKKILKEIFEDNTAI